MLREASAASVVGRVTSPTSHLTPKFNFLWSQGKAQGFQSFRELPPPNLQIFQTAPAPKNKFVRICQNVLHACRTGGDKTFIKRTISKCSLTHSYAHSSIRPRALVLWPHQDGTIVGSDGLRKPATAPHEARAAPGASPNLNPRGLDWHPPTTHQALPLHPTVSGVVGDL